MKFGVKGKRAICVLFCFMLIFTLFAACDREASSGAGEGTAKVKIYEAPDGVELYEGARAFVEGKEVPLYRTKYNASQVWSASAENRKETGFAYFDFEGEVQVKLIYASALDVAYLVRPSAYGVTAKRNVEENSVTFTLSAADNYSVEPINDAKQAICLFCNEPETEAEEFYEGRENVLYFGPGLHTAKNSGYIGEDNVVRVRSGQTVYLAEGAVLRAKIQGDDVSDVRVTGRGILDGSAFERDPNTGKVTVPIEFNRAKNVTVENIVLNDPAGWCVQYYFVDGGKIDNVRILSSRANGDGVSLQSCKNITVTRTFARTWDDCLVVKNYPQWSDRSKHGATRNILFEYCTVWADLAQCMEVGYETVGAVMEDIVFRNITVLHAFHKPVMSIHNANNAQIKRVTFENVTVEDAAMGQGDAGSNRQLVELTAAYSATWSDGHTVTELGNIDGVTVANVWVYSAKTPIEYRVEGSVDTRETYYGSTHFVGNVTFDGIKIGTCVENAETARLTKNAYTNNIRFLTRDSSEITGAEVYGRRK